MSTMSIQPVILCGGSGTRLWPLSRKPDEVVHRAVAPNLELITTGTMPPNSGELLLSPSMVHMLQDLSAQYDLVLIDTPPVLAVSDTQAIRPNRVQCFWWPRQRSLRWAKCMRAPNAWPRPARWSKSWCLTTWAPAGSATVVMAINTPTISTVRVGKVIGCIYVVVSPRVDHEL